MVLFAGAPALAQMPYFPSANQPAVADAPSVAPDSEPAPPAATAPMSRGYRLHLMAAGPMSFTTSNSAVTLPFETVAPADVNLSIGLISGAGLDPQNSEMSVYVNDSEILRQPLSAEINGRIELPIAAQFVRAGVNLVRVQIRQANGSCQVGPEVWAELNPEYTFVDMAPGAKGPTWINPGPDGYINVAYVRSGEDARQSASAVVTAGMRLSHHLSRTRLKQTVYSQAEDVPDDVDLIVFTSPAPAGFARADAVIMTVQQVETLTQSNFGTTVAIDGRQTRPLRDFGVVADGWTEGSYTRTLMMRLPDTFLSMSSGSMRVQLNGSTQNRLSAESTIIVRVNNQISASAPLPPRWGQRDGWSFDVPMHHMRPGINRVDLIFETEGAVCGMSSGGNMALFGDSQITFPKFGEGRRLSIASALSEDPVYLVVDKVDNTDVAVVVSALSRLARSADLLPQVEFAEASAWLEGRNALILSTGEPGTRAYEALFGIAQSDVTRWRTAIQQRVMDLQSQDGDMSGVDIASWAREAYAYRSIDIPREGVLTEALQRFVGTIFGVQGVDLRGDDVAFVVTRRGAGGGTHVMLSLADISQAEMVGDVIGTSGFFLFDGRAAHIEMDGNVRPYRDYGLPVVTNMSASNLRLVFADVVSGQYIIYVLLVLCFGALLAISTRLILPKK